MLPIADNTKRMRNVRNIAQGKIGHTVHHTLQNRFRSDLVIVSTTVEHVKSLKVEVVTSAAAADMASCACSVRRDCQIWRIN